MTGISRHVLRSLHALGEGDLEDALYQIAPAIDATSKKRYGNIKPSKRFEAFLADEQDLIYAFSTRNIVSVSKTTRVMHGPGEQLHEIIYKYVRNAQSHDAKYDTSKIFIGGEFGVARIRLEGLSPVIPKDKYLISTAVVFALIFTVICSPENSKLDLPSHNISIHGRELDISDFVGKRPQFIKRFTAIFDEYDLDKT